MGNHRHQMRTLVVRAHSGMENFGRNGKKLGDPSKQKKKQGTSFQSLKMAKRHHRHHADGIRHMSSEDASSGALVDRESVVDAVVSEEGANLFHHQDIVSQGAWYVLHTLRKNGHENYLVGGTVRDFVLGQNPKDFDIVTSAEPEHIKKLFPRKSRLLGKRFPIVHVRHNSEIIEVSSFRTNCDDAATIPLDYAALFLEEEHASSQSGKGKRRRRSRKVQNDATWSMARQHNALKRDFTVNGLFYDPFTRVLFDYVGGVSDCHGAIIRTIDSPQVSFADDPARILRAIRLSSRLHMAIDHETRKEMVTSHSKVLALSHGRLQMELHAMFAYGSSRAAFILLEEFDMVSGLLPMHFDACRKYDGARDILLRLLAGVDTYATVEQPVDPIVWNGAMFSALVFSTLEEKFGKDAWNTVENVDIVDEVSNTLLCTSAGGRIQLLSRNSIETVTHMLKFLLIQHSAGKETTSTFSSVLRKTRASKGLATLEKILRTFTSSQST